MADNENFNQKIILAVLEREQQFNSIELPKAQENYRLHLSCIRNIIDALVKRSLIVPDPYKTENKIADINVVDTTPFADNERQKVLGIRLSDYESMLDYICNYMRFSVDQLTMERIRKLVEYNNTFTWNSLTQNSTKSNTRALATLLNELKANSPQMALSLLKDSVGKSQEAMAYINEVLKSLAEFQKERFKVEVRKNVLESPQFNKEAAYKNVESFVAEARKTFTAVVGKKSVPNEILNEIACEEVAPNKEELQRALLDKVAIKDYDNGSKEKKIDIHEILMNCMSVLGSSSDQFNAILQKIIANSEILQSEKNTFRDKLARLFRRLFGLPDPEIIYEITITDKKTDAKRKESIAFNEFVEALSKKIKGYANFANPESTGYARVKNQTDAVILDYLNKQIVENNKFFAQLVALDEYFKNNVNPLERSKIRGITMELTTIRNIIVKSNQIRAEYVAYAEEQEQMRKLGI